MKKIGWWWGEWSGDDGKWNDGYFRLRWDGGG